jgi:uroporphyrinogen-III synthase
MKNTPKTLLFLNAISSEQLHDFNSNTSLVVDCKPVIETKPLTFNNADLDVNIPWVFTSRSAVEAIKGLPLSKKLYAIGSRTSETFTHAIIPKKSTATDLAKLIIENKEKEVIFICGSSRRNDLPEMLKSFDIKVKEVHVYQTINLNKTLNLQSVDGLAFMSPSAVYSFLEKNEFNGLPCFAIGPTTAQALKNEGQDFITSNNTDARSIVEVARKYFNT